MVMCNPLSDEWKGLSTVLCFIGSLVSHPAFVSLFRVTSLFVGSVEFVVPTWFEGSCDSLDSARWSSSEGPLVVGD